MDTYIINAKTALAFPVNQGQHIKIIDIEGKQIADFIAYNRSDFSENLDPVATRDALGATEVKIGDSLYSTLYRPMLKIINDTVGKHDLFSPACRPEMYQLLFHKNKPFENCYHNLNNALIPYNIPAPKQHYPFNIFMNTVLKNGKQKVEASKSKAGDYIELQAEMDMLVAISACPNEESPGNNHHSTAIEVQVN